MNRQEFRKVKRFAKKKGVDVDNLDMSIVTQHYESDYIQVITEQSSYLIDLKNKRALRIPGDDASHQDADSKWYNYDTIYSCSVSFPLRMTWMDGDRLIMRTTTPITLVNELTASEAVGIAGEL
jgi:alpha-mannosidase